MQNLITTSVLVTANTTRGKKRKRGCDCFQYLEFSQALLLVFLIQFSCKAFCIDIYFLGRSKNIVLKTRASSTPINLNIILFEINGKEFEHININDFDNELTHLFEGVNKIRFIMHNLGRISNTYIPPLRLQKNFIRCVVEGMCSFIVINSKPENARIPSLHLTLKNLGFDSIYPCCRQLTYFLEMGITSFPVYNRYRSYNTILPASIVSNYSILEFHGSSGVVHEMIYIGHGLGFSKLGGSFLYFHTISSIKSFYEEMFGEELEVREFKYPKDDFGDDFDPPPPSAGAGVAT